MYIEMKKARGGKTSPEQKKAIEQLTGEGYFAVVCEGAVEAKGTIAGYLSLNKTEVL